MPDRRFIRVLTDSSDGKRLLLVNHYEIPYVGAASLTAFSAGDTVTGSTSGATGTVKRVITLSTATGTLLVTLDKTDGVTEAADFVSTENIQVSAVTKAQVGATGGYPVYQQQMSITSVDNPNNGVVIDDRGAMSTRFTEGSPTFDSFGKMQVTSDQVLSEYISKYDLQNHLWFDEVTIGAALAHEPDHRGTVLTCTTTSGAAATRTSHLYHPYVLGVSQSVEMTVACGDSGKVGSYRLWGYGDDDDGLFFVLNETSFEVLIRSTATGVIAEDVIHQNLWNMDRLDGSNNPIFNISGHTLDVTKDVIYWVDLQWLGAGRVRFGVIIEGERIVAHESYHSNKVVRSYMRSADLPIRIQNKNIATTGSSSEIRYWGFVVKSSSGVFPSTRSSSVTLFPDDPIGLSKPGGSSRQKRIFNYSEGRPLVSLRPKDTSNGSVNRNVCMPKSISVSNLSNAHMNIGVLRAPILVGSSWSPVSAEGGCECDSSGELATTHSGTEIATFCLSPNSSKDIPLDTVFNLRCDKVILAADGINQSLFQYSFVASILSDSIIGDFSAENLSFSTQTITRASGNFTTDGYVVGDGLHIKDSLSNDGYYIISAVGSTTMAVESSQTFTTENNTSGVTLTSGPTGNAASAITVSDLT